MYQFSIRTQAVKAVVKLIIPKVLNMKYKVCAMEVMSV